MLAVLTVAAITLWRRPLKDYNANEQMSSRAGLAGWLWFLGTLVPVIGLMQSGLQSRADRFTYWPSIGLFAALVFPWPAAWFASDKRRQVAGLITCGTLLICGVYTTLRLLEWRDPLNLYLNDIRRTGRNAVLKSIVATYYDNQGDAAEAEKYYRASLDDQAGLYDTNFNYARLLQQQQRWEDAAFHYSLALRVRPNDPRASEGLQQAKEHRPSTLPVRPGAPH